MKSNFVLRSVVAAIVLSITVVCPYAATNAWTSLITGNWHDPSWSLNVIPSYDQDAIVITNHESKAVIIGAVTAEDHAASLQIRKLFVNSPIGWTNTVLLNYLASREPLTVFESAFVGSGGVLMNLYSKLNFPGLSGSLTIDGGEFVQEGGITTVSNNVFVGGLNSGSFALANGNFIARNVIVGKTNSGLFIQDGGTVTSDVIDLGYSSAAYQLESGQVQASSLNIGDRLPPYTSFGNGVFRHRGGTSTFDEVSIGLSGGSGEYILSGGSANIRSLTVSQSGSAEFRIQSGRAEVEHIVVSVNERERGTVILDGGELQTGSATVGYSGWGSFKQYGGVHNVGNLTVSGDSYRWVGTYTLTNGVLNAGEISLTTGVMDQSGGTNRVTNIVSLAGRGSGFTLSGGILASGGCSIGGGLPDERSIFEQLDGTHQINGSLSIGGRYRLSGGTLVASSISLYGEGELNISGGNVASNLAISFTGGSLSTSLSELTLGTLQINQAPGLSSSRPSLSFPTNDCIIRFADSHHLAWDPETHLWIFGWNGNLSGSGLHQLFIGTGQTLSQYQLSRIRFNSPTGLPAGSYFAKQLSSGEIVPSQDWYIEFMRQQDGLRFEWDSQWLLEFSTTPQGPYQPVQNEQNIYTTAYSGRSGFFRLRKKP